MSAQIHPVTHSPQWGERSALCPSCGARIPDVHMGTSVCEPCLFGLALGTEDTEFDGEKVSPLPFTGTGRRLGSYEVLEEIGRGGMGIIHRAVHHETGEVAALKTVLPQFRDCAETVARFRREAKAASSLNHPHSIPIHEVGEGADGLPFFSMKLAEGGSLHQLTEKYRGRWRQIARLMIKISSAVHHAHGHGLLHRDLKPGNILFTEDHEPMVTDFGLVKQFANAESLTESCAILGTPNYLAPEHAAGRTHDLTAASDIYSLGAVFFELLAGRPPFVGTNALDVLRQVSESTPPKPSRFVLSIPKALEAICMRCLERQPQDRYASAQALADDLSRWLKDGRIARAPLRFRLSPKLRRHSRLLEWLIGVSLFSIVVGSAAEIIKTRSHHAEPAISTALMIEDLSQDASLGATVGEVTRQLRQALSNNEELQFNDAHPVSRGSSSTPLQPLGYARSVNAQGLIAGSVRKVDNKLRLTVRLLRVDPPGVTWWCQESVSLDGFSKTLPTACQKIAAVIHSKRFTNPDTHTAPSSANSSIPEAMAFYVKARELAACRNERDMREAVTLFRHAVDLDPRFVAARAMHAYALYTLSRLLEDRDTLLSAIADAKIAIAQDTNCAVARRVIANCLFDEGRYAEALDEFLNVLEIDPQSAGCNLSVGECLREMGHPAEALPWLERAVNLEPAHGIFSKAFAETLMLISRDDQAAKALQHAADLEPDQPESLICLSVLRVWQKRFGEATAICAQMKQRFPDSRFGLSVAAMAKLFGGDMDAARSDYEVLRGRMNFQRGWECYGAVNPSSALAWIAGQRGDLATAHALTSEALELDRRLLVQHPRNSRLLHDLAATYAVAEDFPKALDYLKEAIAAGWVEHRSTLVDPRFRPLAENPAFIDLLKKTSPKDLETVGSSLIISTK